MKTKILLTVGLALLSIHTTRAQQSVKDIDGNVYQTIKIGQQIWMTENLRTTKFNNGTKIPLLKESDYVDYEEDDPRLNVPNYGVFADEFDKKKEVGLLYNKKVALSNLNVCPVGWRIPYDEDFQQLIKFVDPSGTEEENNAGIALKATEDKYSHERDYKKFAGTNSSGFSAVPSGERMGVGDANLSLSNFWAKQKSDPKVLVNYVLGMTSAILSKRSDYNLYALPIRCIKNEK